MKHEKLALVYESGVRSSNLFRRHHLSHYYIDIFRVITRFRGLTFSSELAHRVPATG